MKNNSFLEGSEYLRLVTAAELLGCSTHELLHFGAIGKAEISAPVLLKGTYEWPVAWDGTAFPELEPPFISDFDIRDRVVLFADDLKKLEAVGWVTPKAFFSPTRGLEIAKHWRGASFSESVLGFHDPITDDQVILNKTYFPSLVIDMQAQTEVTESMSPGFFTRMQEHAVSIPWYLASPETSDENDDMLFDAQQNTELLKTTAEHLFISKTEFNRLAANAPQDPAALKRQQASAKPKNVHGNSKRYSSNREQVLAFAIYCKEKWPADCFGSVTKWVEVIEEKARLRWDSGEPPLSTVETENLLRDAVGNKTR